MDVEEDFVDMENADTKVWLVKVPKFVAEHWANIEEPGIELGRMRIYKEQTANNIPKVKLILPEDEDEDSVPIPKNYNVTMTSITARNQYVFTENSGGVAVGVINGFTKVTGRVEHEASAGPIIDDDYRRIMQLRTKAAADETNSRQAQIIQGRDRGLLATAGNQWDEGSRFMARGRAKKLLTEKKERIPREDLQDLIFSLFESKTHISFKELIQKTNQPVSWLKEVLTELCDLNRRGPNAGTYQLKVEYRQTPIEQPGPSNPIK